MAYIEQASTWRARKRHRQRVTLVVVLVVLIVAGGVGYAVYSGAIGDDGAVDVQALPPCPSAKAPLRPQQVVVNVYNATTRPGLAAKTATTLSLRSFAVKTVANDPR
ncbi:LytR C-terminal domain-containing protein, partial [Phycicoccus elongatus]|uniref:LytR C-terminal domain-containing protein n=1 Tax=Phycicoccus elongatus TaxID=101689 RepID=UPI0005934E6B